MTEPVEIARTELISALERIHRIMSAAHEKPAPERKMMVWKDDVLAIERAIRELKA
jgi:hypothetical protein